MLRAVRRTSLALVALAVLAIPLPVQAGQQVPFKARDTGTFVIEPTSDPAVVVAHDVGTGRATHLGRYSLVAQETVNLETLEITNGSYTLTGANGDTVSGTYQGHAAATGTPGVITYRVAGPITGGTGRFAGARGHLVWNGGADLSAGTLFDKITGTISPPKTTQVQTAAIA